MRPLGILSQSKRESWLSMMARNEATTIALSEKQEKILRKLQSGTHSPLHLKQRAEIILLANEGASNNRIMRTMGISGETVTKWRNRYAASERELSTIEADQPQKLRATMEKTLSDERRSGRTPTFSDEQVACIIALSCQKPDDELGLPFSHWSLSLLREEAIKRGIVESISTVQIMRFLKGERAKATSSERMAES